MITLHKYYLALATEHFKEYKANSDILQKKYNQETNHFSHWIEEIR